MRFRCVFCFENLLDEDFFSILFFKPINKPYLLWRKRRLTVWARLVFPIQSNSWPKGLMSQTSAYKQRTGAMKASPEGPGRPASNVLSLPCSQTHWTALNAYTLLPWLGFFFLCTTLTILWTAPPPYNLENRNQEAFLHPFPSQSLYIQNNHLEPQILLSIPLFPCPPTWPHLSTLI